MVDLRDESAERPAGARRFHAEELCSDATLTPVELALGGSAASGWTVERNGRPHLSLGPGFRLLRSARCGVCSTDLDRPFLPFPLPQVTGHEVVALDDAGRRFVVEINASHAARGVASRCPFCRADLASHCPDRLVLGIHDLPGGFGPYLLAPVGAVLPVPASIPDDVAVLVEPFAAALHAADRIAPRTGERIAVLGPRRLGLLVVAALAARRRASGVRFDLEAFSRRDALCERALRIGADTAGPPPAASGGPRADVVVDTTGSPDGLVLALALAGRAVHVKSTHGRPSAGLAETTALVVDELEIARLPRADDAIAEAIRDRAVPAQARPVVAWLAAARPPASLETTAEVLRDRRAAAVLERLAPRADRLPRADVAVVDGPGQIDEVIRPVAGREVSLVRPRGLILLHPQARPDPVIHPLAHAVVGRGLGVAGSRCGDFREALWLLESDAALRAALAGLITHRLPAARLAEAMRLARSPEAIKVVIEHPGDPRAA